MKKNTGTLSDRARIKKLNDSIFRTAKSTDSIFANNKSEFYPKKKSTIKRVVSVAKKIANTVNEKTINKIAKKPLVKQVKK